MNSSVRKCGEAKPPFVCGASVLLMTEWQRREVDRAQARSGPGLATADDCDDGGEFSRVGLQCPKLLKF